MGEIFSKLKENIIEANIVFTSEEFFTSSGFRMVFQFKDGYHPLITSKNIIIAEVLFPNRPPKIKGSITGSDVPKAIRIAEHIISIGSIKPKTVSEDNICCICLDKPIDIILVCGHGFCEKDIMDWNNREHNCPMCRENLCDKKMFTSLDEFNSEEIEESLKELDNLFT